VVSTKKFSNNTINNETFRNFHHERSLSTGNGSIQDYRSYTPTPNDTLESSHISSLGSSFSDDGDNNNMVLQRKLTNSYDSSIGRPKPRFTHNSSGIEGSIAGVKSGIEFTDTE